jgi:hypothetical protein
VDPPRDGPAQNQRVPHSASVVLVGLHHRRETVPDDAANVAVPDPQTMCEPTEPREQEMEACVKAPWKLENVGTILGQHFWSLKYSTHEVGP